jgi:hypothetical protein
MRLSYSAALGPRIKRELELQTLHCLHMVL